MMPSMPLQLDMGSNSQAAQGPSTQSGTYKFEAPHFGTDFTAPAAIIAGAGLIGFLGYVFLVKSGK